MGENLTVVTNGFVSENTYLRGQTAVRSENLVPEAHRLLGYVAKNFLENGSPRDDSGLEEYHWGSTPLVVRPINSDGVLQILEKQESGVLSEAVDLALLRMLQQEEMCRLQKTACRPPLPLQLIALTPAVEAGGAVLARRYPAPAHMSGWWLLGKDFDGDVSKVKRTHCWHLLTTRPDLTALLALPFRYGFDTGKRTIWFDPTLEGDEPLEAF